MLKPTLLRGEGELLQGARCQHARPVSIRRDAPLYAGVGLEVRSAVRELQQGASCQYPGR